MFERNTHSRIRIIFLAAVIILLALSILSYIRIKNLIKSSESVNNTTTVKLELENTFSSLTILESAQRGYFLSNDSAFLEDLIQNRNNINLHLNNVDSLTKDNPSQQDNIKQLRFLIRKRSVYLQSLLAGPGTANLSAQAWTTGKLLMDDVRQQINKMEGEEERLLIKRSSSLDKETFLTPLFSIVLMIAAIGIVIAAYYKINEELKLSGKLKSDLEERSVNLQLLNKSLEEKNRELVKANKELESFTYISSHDLQEPLRKIQTLATRIAETENLNLSDAGKNYFKRLENAANRMQTLIQDLLVYSRAKTEERKFEITDLRIIVEEVKDDLKEEIIEKNAIIEASELCEANIIRFQFRQLLQNLVSNAIKFSKPGAAPHVIISSRIVKKEADIGEGEKRQKDYCLITVRDNGIGIEPKYQELIFELFQRLHGGSEYQGTGIGLAIVKKIVENHNGFISVTSESDKGASFDIYIPA